MYLRQNAAKRASDKRKFLFETEQILVREKKTK